MNILKTILIGTGCIGGTIATLAREAGFEIEVVCIDEETARDIQENGFRLHGARGEHVVKMPAYASIDQLTKAYDVCIIATKVHPMPSLAAQILPHLTEDGLVVGMQNGICTELLQEVVGKERTVSCMIGFGATGNGPNEVTMTSKGEFYIGMPDGQHPPKLDYIKELLNSVLPTQISDNVTRQLYSKLIINSCINATAAITGKTLGVMLDDLRARNLFLAIAREAMIVAKAMGLSVPKYGALLDYRLLMLGNSKPYNSICKAVVWLVGKLKYADVRPSTLQSLERGEITEIDIFNGYIVKKAAACHLDVPVNAKIVSMIKEIERGERQITMDNLDEFDL